MSVLDLRYSIKNYTRLMCLFILLLTSSCLVASFPCEPILRKSDTSVRPIAVAPVRFSLLASIFPLCIYKENAVWYSLNIFTLLVMRNFNIAQCVPWHHTFLGHRMFCLLSLNSLVNTRVLPMKSSNTSWDEEGRFVYQHYSKAMKYIKIAIEKSPKCAYYHYIKAVIQISGFYIYWPVYQKHYIRADAFCGYGINMNKANAMVMDSLSSSISLNPDFHQARHLRALLYLSTNEYTKGLIDDKYLKLNGPQYLNYYYHSNDICIRSLDKGGNDHFFRDTKYTTYSFIQECVARLLILEFIPIKIAPAILYFLDFNNLRFWYNPYGSYTTRMKNAEEYTYEQIVKEKQKNPFW